MSEAQNAEFKVRSENVFALIFVLHSALCTLHLKT
jgi:hypothetical protein